MSAHKYVEVKIVYKNGEYSLPVNGRDGELQNFLINCVEPFDYEFIRPT